MGSGGWMDGWMAFAIEWRNGAGFPFGVCYSRLSGSMEYSSCNLITVGVAFSVQNEFVSPTIPMLGCWFLLFYSMQQILVRLIIENVWSAFLGRIEVCSL